MPSFLQTKSGRRIAYHRSAGDGPGLVFLGGFKSDMEGTKAIHLEEWAQSQDRAFLRFDYSGHGSSSEEFTEGCIGDWADDAEAAINELTEGPQILVGSSMGGWISLLMAKRMPQKIAALVTIAAAPDFTEDSMWGGFSDLQKSELEAGQVALPSEYGEPYIITKKLIEDGRNHLVLRSPLTLPFPTRMLQGTDDADVDMSVALRLIAHASGDDMRLVVLKGGDHRFSEPDALKLIEDAIRNVIEVTG
ncbi:MAG: alpha/beta hydrolase [Pseudomonadota bacterium]